MSTDEEHLRLLAIFHYVVGGLMALFACFPLIHVGMGLFIIIDPQGFSGSSSTPPPAFMGWFFVLLGSVFILAGWAMALCVIAAGRCLAKRKRYLFCLIMGGLQCLFMPIGTVLGVFTIIVLVRDSVKALFQAAG